MKWPQWVAIVLLALEWVAYVLKHGEPMKRAYDARIKTVELALWATVLWCGGFFR